MWRVGMNVSQERTEIMTVNETLGNPSNWTCGVIGSAYLPVTQKGAQAIAGSSPVMSANKKNNKDLQVHDVT